MLDIKLIRNNSESIQKAAFHKNITIDVLDILEKDKQYQSLTSDIQKLRAERNKAAREQNKEEGKRIKKHLDEKEGVLKGLEKLYHESLLTVPNLPKPDVKIGKDETENEVIKKNKEQTKFNFTPKDHIELGEALDIIDVKRAANVSGTRFAYVKGDAVLMEFALVQLALDVLTKEGFIPIVPPVLIKKDIMRDLGYMEHGATDDIFQIEKDNLVLVGTSEHSIVSMHKDEFFNKKDLPKRYVGFSSAFRREAGSYGKDTKGILRVHQFDKVEMVSFVAEEEDDREHEYLLSLEEKLFQMLGIPYQVVKMCTGDLGFPAARKYDIEAWMPGQEKYREVTSVSTVTDFQSRRLNIRYQDSGKQNVKKFVNILNGTAFAIGRTIIAILENYQQEDGTVIIPEVLRKYIGKSVIKVK